MMGPSHRLALVLQVPNAVSEDELAHVLMEEAMEVGLLSAGLVRTEPVVDIADSQDGLRSCRITFLAEEPLDVDQVAAILRRRVCSRLNQQGIPWFTAATQANLTRSRARPDRCRSTGERP